MEMSFLTAFLGGILVLLSPCGALLLPAFFASVVGNRIQLLVHAAVFYLGLIITLVPLGLGMGIMGSLLTQYRHAMIMITAMVLIVLGVAQVFGFGLDLAKVLPGASRIQQRANSKSGFTKTFLLGAASGVAGFCAGPILGAILTLAMAQGNTLIAGTMLGLYGLGMVAPLTMLAAVWHRITPRTMSVLRGRGFTLWGRQFHTTSVITGVLIVAIGVLFWITNGLVSAPSLLPASLQRELQSFSVILANPLVDAAVLIGIVVLAMVSWTLHRSAKRRRAQQDAQNTEISR